MIWSAFLISFWAVPCLVLIATLLLILGIQPGPLFSLPDFGFTLIAAYFLFSVTWWLSGRKQVNIKREAALLGITYLTLAVGYAIGIYAESALGLGPRAALAVANLLWLSLLAVFGHGMGFWNLRPHTPPPQAASP